MGMSKWSELNPISISACSNMGQSLTNSSSRYEEYESVRESWIATKARSIFSTSLRKFFVSMSKTILRIPLGIQFQLVCFKEVSKSNISHAETYSWYGIYIKYFKQVIISSPAKK